MSTAALTRLDRLERIFGDGGECQVCADWPLTRIFTTDAETRRETGATRPAKCPRCGCEPAHGCLEIIGVDIDDLP